jgi:hypothetical protein
LRQCLSSIPHVVHLCLYVIIFIIISIQIFRPFLITKFSWKATLISHLTSARKLRTSIPRKEKLMNRRMVFYTIFSLLWARMENGRKIFARIFFGYFYCEIFLKCKKSLNGAFFKKICKYKYWEIKFFLFPLNSTGFSFYFSRFFFI